MEKKSPNGAEIEITDEMVEAGVLAYYESRFNPEEDFPDQMIREVYLAIRAVATGSHQ